MLRPVNCGQPARAPGCSALECMSGGVWADSQIVKFQSSRHPQLQDLCSWLPVRPVLPKVHLCAFLGHRWPATRLCKPWKQVRALQTIE